MADIPPNLRGLNCADDGRSSEEVDGELSKHGQLGRAAMKASMDPKTARKYREAGRLPSEMKAPREWRTRVDPFERDWPLVMARLEDAPELESKTLFEWLQSRDPERYEAGQLRTLQRRVRQWRAQQGPDRRVYFAQAHVPGEAAQTDFTWATELGITIGGEPFEHMLCHVVLPYPIGSGQRSVTLSRLRR